jgi:hypothetical protein
MLNNAGGGSWPCAALCPPLARHKRHSSNSAHPACFDNETMIKTQSSGTTQCSYSHYLAPPPFDRVQMSAATRHALPREPKRN